MVLLLSAIELRRVVEHFAVDLRGLSQYFGQGLVNLPLKSLEFRDCFLVLVLLLVLEKFATDLLVVW